MTEPTLEQWLSACIEKKRNQDAWQVRDFGPWWCRLTETYHATRDEAVDECLDHVSKQ